MVYHPSIKKLNDKNRGHFRNGLLTPGSNDCAGTPRTTVGLTSACGRTDFSCKKVRLDTSIPTI